MALGARVRRCAEDRSATFGEIAGAIADTLWDAFEERTPPVLALVRVFHARGDGAARCLMLAATAGSSRRGTTWRAPSATACCSLSDPAALAPGADDRQARGGPRARSPARAGANRSSRQVFFVPEAIRARSCPSSAGSSSATVSTPCWAAAAPCRTGRLRRRAVRARADLAGGRRHVRRGRAAAGLALSRAGDLAASPAAVDAARGHPLERLLRLDEYLLLRRVTALARDSDEQRRRAELERTLAEQSGAGVRMQERAQRAMLNVIEDLREARRDLERAGSPSAPAISSSSARAALEQRGARAVRVCHPRTISRSRCARSRAYLQLLGGGAPCGDQLDADGHEFIAYAVGGARRMQELIEALLACSRISRAPVEVEPVQLDRALDEALGALARAVAESGAALEREPLPAVRGDPVLLRQLFQNLLSNAIKFCGTSPPRIEIRADRGAEGRDPAHGARSRHRLRAQVCRTGVQSLSAAPAQAAGHRDWARNLQEDHGAPRRYDPRRGSPRPGGDLSRATFPAAEDAHDAHPADPARGG